MRTDRTSLLEQLRRGTTTQDSTASCYTVPWSSMAIYSYTHLIHIYVLNTTTTTTHNSSHQITTTTTTTNNNNALL